MRYFKIAFLLVALSLAIGSCTVSKTNMNWLLIDFNKIHGETRLNNIFDALSKYQFNQFLILNKNHFILLGDNSKDSNPDYSAKTIEAVVFVSADGGKTLKKHVLGNGSISEAVSAGNVIFAVNELDKDRGSSQLIKSDPLFERWEIVSEFAHSDINNINFYSPSIGVASFLTEDDNNDFTTAIQYTLDGGKTWLPTKLEVADGFGTYVFLSQQEIGFIENNHVVKFNFLTNQKTVLDQPVAPDGYHCEGNYFKDPVTLALYTYIENLDTKEVSVKNLTTEAITLLPKGSDHLEIYGSYFHTLVKDGSYTNYVWSNDKGQNWHTEEIRDFFVMPVPQGFYGKGYVFAVVALFKGKDTDKGGRLAIRRPGSW